MMRLVLSLALVCSAVPVVAQISPIPSSDDPRVQTVVYEPGPPIRLVSFPDSSLKLFFHQGESIERAVLSDSSAFKAAVVGYGDVIELMSQRENASATMRVETNLRQYEFSLETGEGLAAAFSVRLVPASDEPQPTNRPDPEATITKYKLSGDRIVRPDTIYDDGQKTYIEWHPDKALPAVFGLGPGDDEEIVAGYMREGIFVIDRIYPELVFRFNKEVAKASRRVERN